MNSKNEIILYRPDDTAEHIEVRLQDETVWLNRNQIALLFGRDIKTIGKHINNVFNEGELVKELVVANFATTTKHGAIKGKTQTTLAEHYNLDVIISVGYRVKSKQGTQFRIWATRVLRDYLLKGYALNQRMDRIENNYENLNKEVNQISLQLKTQELPNQGIFFNGQVFDAYVFAADLIKKAKSSIILIDNYVDETVLTLLAKRNNQVSATIYTKNISKQLQLDINKHNLQYPAIKAVKFSDAHDRFLILDQKELYHLGASLKDLGKKWFAFSKMEGITETVIANLAKIKSNE
ncbi:MAG: virulence RhuM family protein [Bacteroidetes bacterium]|nr:virulence RhuM family protein [Bacteroidota bacterium]